MTRMIDYDQCDWSAGGRAYLSMEAWGDRSWRYGLYRHPLGLVEVYEQVGRGYTSLRFRWRGRDYHRFWQCIWGDKTIARLAREFIEDVTSGC